MISRYSLNSNWMEFSTSFCSFASFAQEFSFQISFQYFFFQFLISRWTESSTEDNIKFADYHKYVLNVQNDIYSQQKCIAAGPWLLRRYMTHLLMLGVVQFRIDSECLRMAVLETRQIINSKVYHHSDWMPGIILLHSVTYILEGWQTSISIPLMVALLVICRESLFDWSNCIIIYWMNRNFILFIFHFASHYPARHSVLCDSDSGWHDDTTVSRSSWSSVQFASLCNVHCSVK